MNRTKLLLIDEIPRASRALNRWLSGRGLSVVNVKQLDEAIEELSDFTTGARVDVVVLPIAMSAASILNAQNTIRLSCEGQQVDVVTFCHTSGKTRGQLEKIFSPVEPTSSSPRRSGPRAV